MFDVIVCGAGIQGLWTANHLAERKKKVILLEQFPFPHTRGSSQGPSRIIRYSYASPHHTKLMPNAFELWRKLEDYYQSQLFINSGLIFISSDEMNEAVISSLDSIDKPYQLLDSVEIGKKFPGINSRGMSGVFEGSAGVLKADKCLKALQERFIGLGGIMFDNEEVLSITPKSENLVTVNTSAGCYSAKSIVLTCGPWMNKILKPLNLELPLKPQRINVCYWQAKDPCLYETRNNFPALIIKDYDNAIYSTPISEYPGLMKVCSHYGVDGNPDESAIYDRKDAASKVQQLINKVKRYYPNLIPTVAVEEKCFYTATPDEDFILDHHPQYKNIIIGGGFSGHGFKMGPVVGQILADMATGRRPSYDVTRFSLSRFKPKSSL